MDSTGSHQCLQGEREHEEVSEIRQKHRCINSTFQMATFLNYLPQLVIEKKPLRDQTFAEIRAVSEKVIIKAN